MTQIQIINLKRYDSYIEVSYKMTFVLPAIYGTGATPIAGLSIIISSFPEGYSTEIIPVDGTVITYTKTSSINLAATLGQIQSALESFYTTIRTALDGLTLSSQDNISGLSYNGTIWETAIPIASVVDALAIGGDTAHDAVDSGNPVKVGGVAVSGSATPTSVAAADRVRFIANQHGIPYQLGGHPNLIVREFDFGTAAQTDLQLSTLAVAANERCYVVGFEAMCDNANSVAVAVRAGFGTANVPTESATGVSGMIASHPGIAAGSGIVLGNAAGIIAVGGAGEEPRLTSSAATSGNLHVVIRYFIIDETP